jgi:hypothetical protein
MIWRQVTLGVVSCVVLFAAWRLIPHPVVPIGIALAPLLVLGVFRAPVLVVILFVVFSFFRIHEAYPALYNLKIPKMLSLAALMVLFWNIFMTETIKPYWRKEFTLLAVFFGLVTLGVPMATDVGIAKGYYTATYSKIVLMVFVIAWLVREEPDFRLAARLVVLGGMAIAYVAIYNKLNGIGLVEETRVTVARDIGSNLGDPNDLSAVLQFPVSFTVAMALTPRIGLATRLLGVIGFVMLFWAIFATQSRGGLLGVMVVLGIFGVRYIKNKVVLLGGGAVVAGVLYITAIAGRKSGGSGQGVDASSEARLHAWEAARGMAFDNPLFGVGLSNYYNNYYAYTPVWDGLNHAVHSTWFGVLAETGYLGFGVFVALFITLVRGAWGNIKVIDHHPKDVSPPVSMVAQAVFAGLLGTAVSGTFLTMGFTWPIYIAAAFVVAVGQYLDDTYGATANERDRHESRMPAWMRRFKERFTRKDTGARSPPGRPRIP